MSSMETFWMMGVTGMMALFGVVAFIGVQVKKNREKGR